MLQITEFTEAKLSSVTNRIERHGDEEVPAISLGVEIETANTLLDSIDPGIRQALYKAKPDAEPELPGVEQSTPVLRCNSFDTVALTTAHEGWRVLVDDGIDETEPMEFTGVKVDKMRVDAKQGGSIVLKMRLGTSDVDADKLGKLGMHNGQSIWLKLLKPEPEQEPIDGTTAAFQADHQDATDLFSASGTPAGSDDGDDVPADDGAEGNGAGQVEQGDGADEQAAIEAGMAASVASAGLKPKRRGRAT